MPWRAFKSAIGYVDTMLSSQDSYGKFQVRNYCHSRVEGLKGKK